jgi:sugar-specific transcriptional regulator TrmB
LWKELDTNLVIKYNGFMESGAQKNIYESLIKAGFSENETKVFLVLLELGKGTVTEITRRAGLNRTTGYDILDNLVTKGLASISGKEPKQEYLAESPDKLIFLMENQIHNKKEQLDKIKSVLPEMKSIHKVAGRPKVRFYEGMQGLKDVYEDTLSSHEEIRAYATVDDMHQAMPGYFATYYKRRAGKNISIRAIIPATAVGKARAESDVEEKRQSRLIPQDKYYFSPEINIYDNKVMIASWREKLGIIIESAEIADAMKKTFELAWIGAEKEGESLLT